MAWLGAALALALLLAALLAGAVRALYARWRPPGLQVSPRGDGAEPAAASPPLSPPPATGAALAERLGRLDAASQDWRRRVGPSDALQFSVAGRMQLGASGPSARATAAAAAAAAAAGEGVSPLLERLALDGAGDRQKKKPRALRFRGKAVQLKGTQSTPCSPQKESTVTLKRSSSAPDGDEDGLQPGNRVSRTTVAVPRPDDETFTQFYSSVSTERLRDQSLEIKDDDLDQVVSQSSGLLVQKRSVQFQRRRMASRNPIKSLQARTDLAAEYEEVKLGIGEQELRRLRVEQLSKHSTMAVEALAGLASKEDFSSVLLKKALPTPVAKELLLMLVKGRRHVQTRIVEPVSSSINSGDNYVLVTPTEVFNWVGRYSNVIERSRGAEVALRIVQHKEFGCAGANQVVTISEEKATCSLSQQERFWRLLGTNSSPAPCGAGHPDEDEFYETSMIATNMVYEVQEDELVPVDEYWGAIPRISMLDPAKILVFDFGAELYVWNGKNAPVEARRQAQHLAKELWDEGYDYSECDVCPLSVSWALGARLNPSTDDHLQPPSQASARPAWAFFSRVTQHMESSLFREKFLDWPDFSRVIRTKESEENEKQTEASIDIRPCDAKEMLQAAPAHPDLILENTHLGRGDHYYDEERHQHYEVSTLGVAVWHILEYESTQLPDSSLGQFHAGDSYVVRWQYSVTVTGRELGSGQPSRHSVLGRHRCAYFIWQGRESPVSEQGAAALLTIELDRERGPQVRVVQGNEPPALLRLFSGRMAVHAGHRDSSSSHGNKGPWKLYLVRGEVPEEAVLVQVACSMRHLRSRAGLLLVNSSTGVVHVWLGAEASEDTCKVTQRAARELKANMPPEYGFKSGVSVTIHEEQEGQETKGFLKGIGGSNRHLYVSLMSQCKPVSHTPRLFHLSSVSGTFTSTEVIGSYWHLGCTVAYPFLQEDIYGASQPALFLLDAGPELWLWQGWWPPTLDKEEGQLDASDQTGSGAVRWQAERRAAMQTALDYWRLAHPGHSVSVGVPARLVWAGLEPLAFTNLFPLWTDRDDIAELNIRDGRKPGEVLEVETELARLTRSTYPPAQLLQRPLPDGVDPTRLELYLEPHHFQELLGMPKEEFMELPLWKQTNMKKDVGLF